MIKVEWKKEEDEEGKERKCVNRTRNEDEKNGSEWEKKGSEEIKEKGSKGKHEQNRE